MSSSQSSQISSIIGWIESIKPKSVLDLGAGMGQYGFLLRTVLEGANPLEVEGDQGRQRPKDGWQIVIDGIGGFAGDLTPVHTWAYNQIIVGDALSQLAAIPENQYELVIAVDILEHFEKEDGLRFLSEMRRVASRAALVSTPKIFCSQDIPANPYENHRSVWSKEELQKNGFGKIIANKDSWVGVWEKGCSPFAWEVCPAMQENLHELEALFQCSFDSVMPDAQWKWKYAQSSPWGFMVRHEGQAIAFYGGMPRSVSFFGTHATAVLIGDTMVDPTQRGYLTRKGPFFLATSSYLDQYIGAGKAYIHGFGFPTTRALRLGERLGLYVRIDSVFEASWSPLAYRTALGTRTADICLDQLHQIDTVWHEMSADFEQYVLPVRDAAWIQHRFLQHPNITYRIMVVTKRFSGRPCGIIVLKDHGSAGLELMDLIGSSGRLAELVVIARRITGKMGRSRLFAMMTTPVVNALADSDMQVTATEFAIPMSAWKMPAEEIERVRGRWWLMGGDTDSR